MNDIPKIISICAGGFFAMFIPLYLFADAGISPLYGRLAFEYTAPQAARAVITQEYPQGDVLTAPIVDIAKAPDAPTEKPSASTDNKNDTPDEEPRETYRLEPWEQNSYNNVSEEPVAQNEMIITGLASSDSDDNDNADKETPQQEENAVIEETKQNEADNNVTTNRKGGTGNAANFYVHYDPNKEIPNTDYIFNQKSGVIHHPSCRDVKKMDTENMYATNMSLKELQAKFPDLDVHYCGHEKW